MTPRLENGKQLEGRAFFFFFSPSQGKTFLPVRFMREEIKSLDQLKSPPPKQQKQKQTRPFKYSQSVGEQQFSADPLLHWLIFHMRKYVHHQRDVQEIKWG